MADGKVTITVDLDGTSAQQGVKQLKSLLQGLGDSSSSGFNTSTKSALSFGTAMAVASAAIQKGMSIVSGSIGGAVDRVDTLKRFPKTMELLGYSASEAGDTLKYLGDSIEGLPTTLDGIASSTQQLAITTGSMEKGSKLAVAFNNAMLGYGASTEGASNALRQFNQSLGSGKMYAEEFNSVSEAAPGLMSKMAEAFGYGSNGVQDLKSALSNGEITAQQFADKMIELNGVQGGFAEMAQVGAKGIKTSMGNIRNAVTKGIANVIMKFDELSQSKGLGSISDNLDKVKVAINNAFSNSDAVVGKFVDVLIRGVEKVKQFREAFKNTGAITALTQAFSAIQGALEHVFSSLGQNTGFVEGLGKAFGEVVKWIAEAVTKAAEFISSLPPETIKTIAGAVLGAVAAFKGFKTVSGIIKGVSESFGLIKSALSANPFMLAVVGIGALVGAFITAYNTSETFRNKVDAVVDSVKKFIDNLDMDQVKQWGAVIASVAGGFAIFKMMNGWNPFKAFGKGGKKALDEVKNALAGTSGQATQSKGIIEQVFSGLGTLITSIAQGISTVLQGLATALSTVATGFGQAAAMASPAQWLSMGAAMLMVGAGVALTSASIYVLVQAAIQLASAGSGVAIALVGLGIGIAAMAGVLALLGPALTASAVGMVAFGAAVALIGAGIGMAASGLAMLASQLPTIATYGASAASAILALSGAVVAFGAGVTVAGAGLLVLSAGLIAFGAAALVATAGGVALAVGIVTVSAAVAAFGLALQPVASAVKKMSQGAKDAGAGTKQLASGLKSITSLPLGSLVTHLGAVAIGISKISGKGGEIASVGAGMKQLGQGLTTIATSGMMAVTAMTVIGIAITQLSTQMTTLPATLTLAAAGFADFSSQAVAGVAGLSAINAPLMALKTQIMTLAPAFMMVSAGLTVFGSQAMVVGASFAMLGAGIVVVRTGLVGVSTAFVQVGTSATSASAQVINMATSTQSVISAFNSMRGQVQSSMQAILSVITSVGNQMRSQGRQIGQQTASNLAQGLNSGRGQAVSAMSSMMAAIRSAGMSGVGSMRGIGAMIGQGLAAGMMSALGSVTAAANALVAQAERAAQAKAKIHSPSRLFRDNVGRFISQGVAVGILADAYKVDDAMAGMYNRINAFNFKAEDVIGVGKTKLSKVIQVKSDLENAVKATVEIAKEKTNNLMEKALDVAEKAVERPVSMRLDDGTLVAKTGDKFASYQAEQTRRENRMKGIIT